MTNLKRFFKSKFLLAILCLLVLAFSYSYTCRNPEEPPTEKENFSASLTESKSIKKLIVKSSGNTNSQIILYFNSANNIDTITPTAVSQNDYSLTINNFEYDKDKGELHLINNGLDNIKVLKDEADGTTKTITITFTFTTKDDNLNNNSTTVDVDLSLIKSTVFKTTENGQFQEVIKGLGTYDYTGITFNLGTGAIFNKTEISVDNSKSRGDEDKDSIGNITQLGTDIETDLNGYTYNSKGYFNKVTFEDSKSNLPSSGTIATLHFSYELSFLFEGENGGNTGNFTLKANVERKGHTSKWEK